MRRKLLLSICVAIAAPLPIAAQAAAATARQSSSGSATSSNWAGYVVRKSGVHFKRVIGSWNVPAVTCTAGHETYSASWIGLGGYSSSSKALEQIGTDSDCDAAGQARYSAWYELVPEAGHDLKMTVQPGDRISAGVTVKGLDVVLTLANTTRGTSVRKQLRASQVDVTSAEWIIEAPAICSGTSVTDATCLQTDLANFGATKFDRARAITAGGSTGTISSSLWSSTLISLVPDARASRYSTLGSAVPASLATTGSAFGVAYSTVDGNAAPGPGGPPLGPPWFRRTRG
jgi:Peptidase A4 family